jgi:membrane protein YdbS with pleckstrin-like domain
MSNGNELKPNKSAFINYRFIIHSIYHFIFFIIISLVIYFISKQFVLYFTVIFILFKIFNYYSLCVKYKKETYIFYNDKIIRKGGSIFSDFEIELVIKNITHVEMQLPFLQNKFFKTGNVRIESAGSGSTEISLLAIDNPEQTYNFMENIMKKNGFNLTKSNLIQKEKPSGIGVFFEVFKNFISTIFTLIFITFYIGGNAIDFIINYIALILPIIGLILFILFIRSIFQFLDLKNRIYYLYSDTIVYTEGFLTKNNSFIPIENLSDSTQTQTIVDKVFGLFDIKISCQGSKQEIHFKNMINGPTLKDNIDKLINSTKSLVGTGKLENNQELLNNVVKEIQGEKQVNINNNPAYNAKPLNLDTQFTAEYQMDGKRTIVPLLILLPVCLILFPLLTIYIILLVTQIIKLNATKYFVKNKNMEQQYNFLSKKNVEFSNDKITAIIFKENFIDKWFNTCSIHFWSIGSSENIVFSNIKKTENLYESLLSKLGIISQESMYQLDSQFKISDFFKSTIFITIFVILLLISLAFATILFSLFFIIPIAIISIIYILIIIYKSIFYNKSKLTFFNDYIYFINGIFFKEKYYVIYDNIKDKSTTKFPISKSGSIKFNIAGEHVIQQGKNQTGTMSNNFVINYICNINDKDDLIDILFEKKSNKETIAQIQETPSNYTQTSIIDAKQDLSNSLTILLTASIIIFPLIILLPITIPLVIVGVKAKSYAIKQNKIIAKSGIFYKKQTSILFNRFDHIDNHKGMLNKMFKNGSISINTTGSSSAELTVKDISNYEEFYNLLKQKY